MWARGERGGDTGLRVRAARKLTEVDAKIADLNAIRVMLREALAAGCDDLVDCASSDHCPLPFAELAAPSSTGARPRAQRVRRLAAAGYESYQ